MISLGAAFVSGISVAAAILPPGIPGSPKWISSLAEPFDWKNVTAHKELRYERCYDSFECARLLVPLDWQDPLNPAEIALAVIRLPSKVPDDHPSHGGSIILNPGGPGGSGILFEIIAAKLMRDALDDKKHFEIVSFDPRGVSYSSPSLHCFPNWVEEYTWANQKRAAGGVDSSRAMLYHWAADRARAKLCSVRDLDEDIRSYVSTTSVARDMLHLVDKIDEHKQALVSSTQKPLRQKEPKLQYLGTSYGTYLGNVFASMYPDRVQRMILDSTLDAHDWTHSLKHMLTDTDKIVGYFFERCFAVGAACDLFRAGDSDPSDIRRRFDTVMRDLRENPMATADWGMAEVNTYDDFLLLLFASLYAPMGTFPMIATVVNLILTKNEFVFQRHAPSCLSCTFAGLEMPGSSDVTSGILCTDGPDLTKSSLPDFQEWLGSIQNQSMFSPIEAEIRMPCWTWPFRAKWRYTGPFNSSVPILFANNRYDPVTPLENARRMAKQHRGSAVLELATSGHGALFQISKCMWEHARRYMNDGVLPADGTVCQPDCESFDQGCTSTIESRRLSSWMVMGSNLFGDGLFE